MDVRGAAGRRTLSVTDKLSLAGLVLIIGLLLYGARHGPLAPVLRAANLKPDPAAVIAPPQQWAEADEPSVTIEPGTATATLAARQTE